jgi:hypothetical protein
MLSCGRSTYLPSGRRRIEDLDYHSTSFVFTCMKKVARATPNLPNKSEVFTTNDLVISAARRVTIGFTYFQTVQWLVFFSTFPSPTFTNKEG